MRGSISPQGIPPCSQKALMITASIPRISPTGSSRLLPRSWNRHGRPPARSEVFREWTREQKGPPDRDLLFPPGRRPPCRGTNDLYPLRGLRSEVPLVRYPREFFNP